MFNINTLNSIAQIGLDRLDTAKYSISDNHPDPDGIMVRSAKMHDMQFGDRLLCIARAGAGTNNIPVDRCTESGIVVFNTPGANSEAVTELALCALLISSRDIFGGIDWVKSISDQGDEIPKMVENGKKAYIGPEIKGKTLGVIGLGAIGAKIANAALSLGMKVYGYDPYLSVDAAWALSSNIIHATNTDVIYENCDYITIHVPYMDSTRHFINREAIAKMKQGVRIINLARGELVDDDAIIEAIDVNKVARYVTDFPNAKTANCPNIIAIPHLGASTPESEDNCAVMAAIELKDYLENGNITNSVNMPAASMARTADARLCIFHKNVPDMIAKITTALSAKGVNIENMVNSGRKGCPLAYTMIDMDAVPDGLLDAIGSIEGIKRIRIV
ncbi:MAG: 3-phosphoglycerate dehydrogenase [Oscillospiraceae bacterium]|nr:3-phosphoglycerate dehydrogenase [Oscillospiraceae bacterium]